MSKKPRIWANCDAGCKWETVHKSDFLNACSLFEFYPAEDGKWYLEIGKQYKIFSENVANVGYGFSITFKYTDNGTEKTYNFTIPHEDKYANYVVFKLLDASVNTDLTLVYEIAGIRYEETISGTSISLLDKDYLYVDNADKVYLYNDDASYHIDGEQGPKGDTGAKIVSTTLIGQDNDGGNIYEQTFDDGSTAQFTAPRGMKGETGQNGAGCYINGVPTDVNFTGDPQTQLNNRVEKDASNLDENNVAVWQELLKITTITKLWENPSPSSSFVAQTISTPNISTYSFILIKFKTDTSVNLYTITTSSGKGRFCYSGVDGQVGLRNFTVSQNTIEFNNAYWDGNTINEDSIPLEVYGIKVG